MGTPRSKGVAVLLAVLFSFFSRLYTYKRSRAKFWWGFGVSLVAGFLGPLTDLFGIKASSSGRAAIILVGSVILLGIWAWGVIDASTKPRSWYTSYPNELAAAST